MTSPLPERAAQHRLPAVTVQQCVNQALITAARATGSVVKLKDAEITPAGVSRAYALFALAKQGQHLGAFKLARQAYDRLLQFKLPNEYVAVLSAHVCSVCEWWRPRSLMITS